MGPVELIFGYVALLGKFGTNGGLSFVAVFFFFFRVFFGSLVWGSTLGLAYFLLLLLLLLLLLHLLLLLL